MKVTELRLGNIIGLIYDPEKYGVIIALDQSGTVHISNREYPDEIRDVVGIAITPKLLARFGYESYIYFDGREIKLVFHGKRATVTIDDTTTYEIQFVHELQNIVYFNTGQELIDTMEFLAY